MSTVRSAPDSVQSVFQVGGINNLSVRDTVRLDLVLGTGVLVDNTYLRYSAQGIVDKREKRLYVFLGQCSSLLRFHVNASSQVGPSPASC
jgi:hypothetical protein